MLSDNQKDKLKRAIIEGKVSDKTTLQVFNLISDLEDRVDTLTKELKQEVEKSIAEVKASEINLDKVLESIKGKDGQDSMVPGEQGIQGIQGEQGEKGDKGDPGIDGKQGIKGNDGLDGIEGVAGQNGLPGADGSPDTRLQLVEKINTGKTKDSKIEIKQIEGLDKVHTKLTDSIINRAIGIVDQRTSFLINKINNLPSSGGTVGPGTTNEIAYFNAPTTIASLTTATYPSLTELSYVKGVTSAIQTQLNARATSADSLTQFVGNTAWRVFYSDTNGDVTELALGVDGTFLKSNGASSAPTFATPAGSGDVTKVGTPVDNQVGVWTGDGTIEGDAALTFDTTTNTLTTDIYVVNTSILPDANDGAALGAAGTAFSDLFLAEGAVINWDSSDVTITQTGNILAFAGAATSYTFDAPVVPNAVYMGAQAVTMGGIIPSYQEHGATAGPAAMVLAMYNATAGTQAEFLFYRSKNAAVVNSTVVASGDGLGKISWYGAQQTGTFATQTLAAQIRAEVDGTVTSGAGADMPGRIIFGTVPDGSGTLTDRLILDSAGVFKPATNDGVVLGTTALGYADLHGATGFTLNIANGDAVITHSTGIFTVSTGDLRVTTAGTNTASAVTVGGTQTLTAKTLTEAKIVSGGFLADTNGNELLIFTTTASAVNEITYANAATATNPQFTASGGDTDVGFNFLAKGAGTFRFLGNATQAAELRLYEDTTDGTNFTAFKVGIQAGDITYTLPIDDGDSGEVLSTDGAGVLSWVAGGGVPTTITVADEATDTSSFIAFFTAATGDLGPKTNTNMTFNSNTGVATFASTVLTTTDINGGTLDGTVIGGASAAAITGTNITANTNFLPDANDGAGLGVSGTAFSDLFLASGAVINFLAGAVTVTHSANTLTIAGSAYTTLALGATAITMTGALAATGARVSSAFFTVLESTTIELGATSDTTLSRVSAGLIAVEGITVVDVSTAQTLTNKDISSTTNTYRAASLTVVGGVELATTAEINTGTDTTRAMPVDQFVASNRNVKYFLYRVLGNTTDNATGTAIGGDLELPFTGTITEVGAWVDTAGVTGVQTIDINLNGTTVISTKITIDSTEKSSRTAAAAPVISVTAVTAGDIITVDVDGIQTTAAKGLTVRIGIRQT